MVGGVRRAWSPSDGVRTAVVGFVVGALLACGSADTELPQHTPLSGPTNLSAQPEGLTIALSWDPVAGAASYLVYWAQASTVTVESGTRAATTAPPYFHQASAFGLTYAYVVVAVDTDGRDGRPSGVITTTPNGPAEKAPRGVQAQAGDREVTLDWEPVEGATSYQIEVASAFGTFAVPDQVVPPFVHRSLLNRTEYRYRVRGRFGSAPGPWSDEVAAVPMPATPGTPLVTDVTARIALVKTAANPIGTPQGEILLSWSRADHAMSYQVYVRTADNAPEQPLIDSTGFPFRETTYRHTPIDFGVTYTYRVEADNDGVTSAPLNQSSDPLLLAPDRARASVPFPLDAGVAYSYAVRGVDGDTESADVLVTSEEPPEAPYARDLSWTPPTGGPWSSQRLYRTSPGGRPSLIAAFEDLTTSTYYDLGLADNVPTGLTAASQGSDVLIRWSPIAEAVSGYRLYWWDTTPGAAGTVQSRQVLDTTYRRTGLPLGSTYVYAVQREGRVGVSPSSSAP